MADQTTPPNVQYPSVPQPPPYPQQPVQFVQVAPRRSALRGFFMTILVIVLILSIILNFILIAALASAHVESRMVRKTLVSGSENKTVAVYRLSGIIDSNAARQFETFVRDILDDSKVRAVVLRVESPGGGVSASDEIWAQVRKLKDSDRKVIVSMGAVAASGGYYISSGADEIFAEETTITGSIGVIMEWFVVERGLNKIGVDPIVLKSSHASQWKDELSFTKFPDDRQKAHLRDLLDTMQARFEKVVKDGRGAKLKVSSKTYTATMPESASASNATASAGAAKTVEVTETEPLNGKIYLGPEAKTLGLVDDIGYLEQAIDRAKKLAGLTNPSVIQFERRRGLFDIVDSEQAPAGSVNIKIDAGTIDELESGRMMLLWKP